MPNHAAIIGVWMQHPAKRFSEHPMVDSLASESKFAALRHA